MSILLDKNVSFIELMMPFLMCRRNGMVLCVALY